MAAREVVKPDGQLVDEDVEAPAIAEEAPALESQPKGVQDVVNGQRAEAAAERPRPANVITALHAVLEHVGGIEKTRAENLSYKIRGIDQISAAAQPLLGKYGVVIVPTVMSQETRPIIVNGNPWTDTEVRVLWKLYGPGGVTDMIESETTGLGRDNSDKGINKAMTGAFKNLLLRVLCIGDPADDTDGVTVEADAPMKTSRSAESLAVYDRLVDLGGDHPTAMRIKEVAQRAGKKITAYEFDRDSLWRDQVEAILNDKPANIDDNGEIHGDPPDDAETPPDAPESDANPLDGHEHPEPADDTPTDTPNTDEKPDDFDQLSTDHVDETDPPHDPEPTDR